MASELATGPPPDHPALSSELHAGVVCAGLTLVRWEFAGCRNPDGGPIEIEWADGAVTFVDRGGSGGIDLRTAADPLPDGVRHLHRPDHGRWRRVEVVPGHDLAPVLGRTVLGTTRVGALDDQRLLVWFDGGVVLSFFIFHGEVRVEVPTRPGTGPHDELGLGS